MEPVLVFDNVSKRFARHYDRARSFMDLFVSGHRRPPAQNWFWVVQNFSLQIMPGEAVGIIGDNGAGKSTILKLGARIVEPTSGRVSLHGRVGALLEVGVGFHPDLTGRENVFLSGAIIGLSRKEMVSRFDEIVAFSGIGDFIDMPVRQYSSGMLVRLGFSVATAVNPDILLVDEVLSVGDYAFRQQCLERIAALQRQGASILYVSHNLEEVRRVCDRAIWLYNALPELEGLPDEVVRAYLNHTLRERGLQIWDLGNTDERGRRLGSGDLEILDCVTLDEQQRPTHTFINGAPFVVRIDYRCLQPIRQAVFGVSIYTEEGVRVANPDSQVLYNFPASECASIYLLVPDLPLRPGKYDLTVAASDPTATEYKPYAHHQRAYTFEVIAGKVPQEGLVRLGHTWIQTSEWEQIRAALKG